MACLRRALICNNLDAHVILRFLLAIVSVLAVLGGTPVSYAASGWEVDATCCCPDPGTCKCHHDREPSPDSQMKRCDGGGHLEAPAISPALPPPAIANALVPARAQLATPLRASLPEGPTSEPETPPF